MGEPLLSHFSVLQVLTLGPRLEIFTSNLVRPMPNKQQQHLKTICWATCCPFTVTFGRSRKDLLLHCFCMATSFSIISCCCGSRVGASCKGVGVTTVDVRAVSSSCCFFSFFNRICSSESTPVGYRGCWFAQKLNVRVKEATLFTVDIKVKS